MTFPSQEELLAQIANELRTSGRISTLTRKLTKKSPHLAVHIRLVEVFLDVELVKNRVQVADEHDFVLATLERCLLESDQTSGLPTRFETAGYLLSYFKYVWRTRDEALLVEIRESLAKLLRRADDSVKEALLLGFLEHALIDQKVDEFFAIWESDPFLRVVLKEARFLAAGFRQQRNDN